MTKLFYYCLSRDWLECELCDISLLNSLVTKVPYSSKMHRFLARFFLDCALSNVHAETEAKKIVDQMPGPLVRLVLEEILQRPACTCGQADGRSTFSDLGVYLSENGGRMGELLAA